MNDMSCDISEILEDIKDAIDALTLTAGGINTNLTAQLGLINGAFSANLGSLLSLDSLVTIGTDTTEAINNLTLEANCSPDVTVNCGDGYGGRIPTVGRPIDGGIVDSPAAPPLGDPEVDPPPGGFDTWEDYNGYKCKAAQFLCDSQAEWFIWFHKQAPELQGLLAGAVAASLLEEMGILTQTAIIAMSESAGVLGTESFIVGAELALFPVFVQTTIVVAVAGVVVLAGVGVLYYFRAVAEELISRRDEIVCALYGAQDIDEARAILVDYWTEALVDIVIDPPYEEFDEAIRSCISFVLSYSFPNSFLNLLFEQSQFVTRYDAPESLCGSCGGYWLVWSGEEIEYISPGVWEHTAGVTGCPSPSYTVSANRYGPLGNLPGNWTITVVSGSIVPPGTGGGSCENSWRGLYCGDDPVVEFSNTTPTFPLTISGYTIRSSQPFTVRIEITDEGEVEC